MNMIATTLHLREQAMQAADDAAHAAGVTIRDLHEMDELIDAGELFDETWEVHGESLVHSNLARALTHAGNFYAGAFAGDRLLGAVVGFLGMRGERPHLHSHVLAVRQSEERRGVGFALKQYQRAWALSRGLSEVYWTFDPLVRRNAFFNLSKLGAEIVEYHVNFYGAMSDGMNAGDESDRVLIRWRTDSERAVEASEGFNTGPDVDRLRREGAAVLLGLNGDGTPALGGFDAPVLLCRVPDSIVDTRRSDPALGAAWREALRVSMGRVLSEGYAATAMSRTGWYVLEREDSRI